MSIANEILSDLRTWQKQRYWQDRCGVGRDIAQRLLHGLSDRLPGFDIELIEPHQRPDGFSMEVLREGEFAIVLCRGEEVFWAIFNRATVDNWTNLDIEKCLNKQERKYGHG